MTDRFADYIIMSRVISITLIGRKTYWALSKLCYNYSMIPRFEKTSVNFVVEYDAKDRTTSRPRIGSSRGLWKGARYGCLKASSTVSLFNGLNTNNLVTKSMADSPAAALLSRDSSVPARSRQQKNILEEHVIIPWKSIPNKKLFTTLVLMSKIPKSRAFVVKSVEHGSGAMKISKPSISKTGSWTASND
uniref:Uncharacterized protein n=1 Tax=Romanomermis culicivorax TaxID=13658 RepID=A0A915K0R3_ROMCU